MHSRFEAKSFGRKFACSLLSAATAVSGAIVPMSKASAQSVQRPPQYVLLAFDGSYSHNMWNLTRQFSKDMKSKGKDVRFTYFISSVYYVGKSKKSVYNAPKNGVGKSAIGWGEDATDLLTRYDHTNAAFSEGHEIASHAVGHFDGSSWSASDWTSEFSQFNNMIFNFMQINQLSPTRTYPNGWLFGQRDVVGFRAPQLGVSKDLWPTLRDFSFRYDTSKVDKMSYWPERNGYGTWNFPLAEVRIAGTGKKTLSMDFNFYVAQSKGNPDPANSALYEKQMYETYLQYFENNYNGNRAPVNIGHHFSLWNGGAYWSAMKRFADKVCGLPEVKCVTYRELADFMDQTSSQTLAAYKAGNFAKSTPVTLADAGLKPLDVDMKLALVGDRLAPKISGSDAQALVKQGLTARYFVNGKQVSRDSLSLSQLRGLAQPGSNVTVSSGMYRNGVEVLSQSHKVQALGTQTEMFQPTSEETRALSGDLPEAHLDELNEAHAH